MRFKTFENFNDDEGQILLYYDDNSPTTWFFIQDAIKDGLLDERFGIDDDIIEDIGQSCFDEEYITQDDLCDMIMDDFEGSLRKIFEYLLENGIVDEEVSVKIEGEDEDGEDWDFYYEPSEEVKYQNQVKKTSKKYNI
ncbi:hypothetical protein K9L67_06195 [Candidatus Woesearchaeota archaeon]|nr:hypothetical protein [Candidatus Woesearchaeota archaeon]MCF7901783.1 hypothetical protein [Candidatus Woesearchaeota archaeon]